MELDLSIVLFGLSAFCLIQALVRCIVRKKALSGMGLTPHRKIDSPIGKIAFFASEKIPPRVVGMCRKLCSERLRELIVVSGHGDALTAESFFAGRLAVSLMGLLLGPIILPFSTKTSLIVGLALGWFATSAWLKKSARERKEAIEKSLPNTFDWLALTVEAGIDFAEAVKRISQRIKKGPLKEELTLLNVKMGMGIPRRDAMLEMVRRAPVPSFVSSVSLIIQADRMGTSIGPVLKSQAERLRGERLARAEKKGALAAQKALLPLTFCIMPATFVVVFGPLVVRILTGGFDSLF